MGNFIQKSWVRSDGGAVNSKPADVIDEALVGREGKVKSRFGKVAVWGSDLVRAF